MNKRELAIIAGLSALAGCGKSHVDRDRAREISRQMLGDPSKEIQNFRWGGTPEKPWTYRAPIRDLPSTMQKSRIDR